MAYFSKKSAIGSYTTINDTGLGGLTNKSSSPLVEFYEFEPAVVLDVILDENHPLLTNKTKKIMCGISSVNLRPKLNKAQLKLVKEMIYSLFSKDHSSLLPQDAVFHPFPASDLK